MSLSHAEMALTQKCTYHARESQNHRFDPEHGKFVTDGKDPSFRPDQGKFFRTKKGTLFACFECLNKRKKKQATRIIRRDSRPQAVVFEEFYRAGIRFKPNYRLGRWPFDLGFPELRFLLEVDGPQHFTKKGKQRDHNKEGFAREHGYTVVHVPAGPKLVSRCKAALDAHKESIGA